MKNSTQHQRLGCLLLVAIFAGCSSETEPLAPTPPKQYPAPEPISYSVPGVPPMSVPSSNPTTVQGVALGRRLFYDTRLSGDNTMSCGTCHQQEFAFGDANNRFSLGIDGNPGDRNTPALSNVGFTTALFWNGRAASPEEQARAPVTNPIEMHTTWPEVVAKLRQDSEYPDLFGLAFGNDSITEDRVVQAIAQFERSMISANSAYDRWRASSQSAPYPEEARRGFFLFFTETGDCFHCHSDFSFTIQEFRDIGLDAVPDSGLARVTGLPEDYGKFKIPTLRNVAVSAPYMHDGRFATLEQVVDHYNSGGHRSPNLDPFIRVGEGLGLTAQQKSDIIAFLHTLTDSTFLNNQELSDPFP